MTIVSCVDLEAPKFGEFAAEQACNDWDGAYVEGVHCDTVKDQRLSISTTIAGFKCCWYKFLPGVNRLRLWI